VVTTPQPAAQRVAQRAAFMAEKVNLEVKGVIENMSWFTGDDGKRYEIFGSGGGEELADRLEVPLLGKVPLVPSCGRGSEASAPWCARSTRRATSPRPSRAGRCRSNPAWSNPACLAMVDGHRGVAQGVPALS
jgi:hypothetical protein